MGINSKHYRKRYCSQNCHLNHANVISNYTVFYCRCLKISNYDRNIKTMSQRRSQAARHLNTMGAKAKLMFNRYLLYNARLVSILVWSYLLFHSSDIFFSLFSLFTTFFKVLSQRYLRITIRLTGRQRVSICC